MSNTQTVTDNSILAWNEMKSLDHAYDQALKKGDVMNAMKNVLAILTLLNRVNITHETEDADGQTRNVEILQQIQQWIEEDGLTAEEIARRVTEMQGEDFLAKYPSIEGLLLASAPALNGTEDLFKYINLEELTALLEEAAASGASLDLVTWLSEKLLNDRFSSSEQLSIVYSDYNFTSAVDSYNDELGSEWDVFLEEENFYGTQEWGGYPTRGYETFLLHKVRTSPEARALVEAYSAAPEGPEKDAAFKDYSDYMEGTYKGLGGLLPGDMQDSFREEALMNAAERLGRWDARMAGVAERLGNSELEKQFYIELGKGGYHGHMGLKIKEDDYVEALARIVAPGLSSLFEPVLGHTFDPNSHEDVKAAAAYLARVEEGPNPQAVSDAAALKSILKNTIGVDFSGLIDALKSDPESLADQIQSKINVDTRLSDNQAISLKQLLQEQQVLLTMINEIINLNTRMNRLVTQ